MGASGKVHSAMGLWAPRLTDRLMEATVISGFQSGRPPRPCDENALDKPSEHLAERGDYDGHVARTSLYTKASLNPVVAGAAVIGAGFALRAIVGAIVASRGSGRGWRR